MPGDIRPQSECAAAYHWLGREAGQGADDVIHGSCDEPLLLVPQASKGPQDVAHVLGRIVSHVFLSL